MTRRVVALLATLLLPATGCSGDDDATATTVDAPITNPTLPPSSTSPAAPTSSIDSTATSTTLAATITTNDALDSTTTSQPPPTSLQPAGDFDWVAIVQGLADVLVELQGAPDPERVSEFCFDSENDCQNIQGESIRQFAEEGWVTIDFPPSAILSAELSFTAEDLPASEASFVVVTVDKGPADFSDTRVVNAEREVVFEVASDGDGGQSNWILARNADGRWRVLSIQSLGEQ